MPQILEALIQTYMMHNDVNGKFYHPVIIAKFINFNIMQFTSIITKMLVYHGAMQYLNEFLF